MTPSSLSSEVVERTEWDVAVIGGGVAGSIVARQAAMRGMMTVLFERRSCRHTKVCGGCLNPRALRVLSQIGLPHLRVSLGGEPLHGVVLKATSSIAQFEIPAGISVTRQCLDSALLNAAVDAGVTVVRDATATVSSETHTDYRQVDIRSADNLCHARARVVICADGLLRSSVQSLPEMRMSRVPGSRVGIGAVFESGTIAGCIGNQFPRGQIVMAIGRFGYVGLSWAEAGQLSVAAALDPAFLKASGSPDAAIHAILTENGIRFPDCGEWHGTPSLTMIPERNATQRLFVIGDAAGYVEPITGEGMSVAMEQAISVMPLVTHAVECWQPSLASSWNRQCRQHFRRRQRVCQVAAAVLRRPWLSQCALRIINYFPGSAEYIVRCISRPTLISPYP